MTAPCCFSATCSRYWDGRFSNSLFAVKAAMALRIGCSFFAACFQTWVGVLVRLGRFDPVGVRARFGSPPPSPSLGGERFDIVAWISSFQNNGQCFIKVEDIRYGDDGIFSVQWVMVRVRPIGDLGYLCLCVRDQELCRHIFEKPCKVPLKSLNCRVS